MAGHPRRAGLIAGVAPSLRQEAAWNPEAGTKPWRSLRRHAKPLAGVFPVAVLDPRWVVAVVHHRPGAFAPADRAMVGAQVQPLDAGAVGQAEMRHRVARAPAITRAALRGVVAGAAGA
jgi:hypothetical protein